jgi:outer membrane protein OmpA-like peptidoglycan-associated protein
MNPTSKLLAAAGVAALAACQTPAPRNAALDQARSTLAEVRSNPAAARGAAVELEQAQTALQRAEKAWESDRDDGRTRHLAYVATQRAEIARNVGEQRAAEARLAEAGAERERAIAQARERELEAARQAQAQAQMTAEQARAQAQMTAEQARAQLQAAQQQTQQARADAQSAQARAQALQQQGAQSAALQRELNDLKARNTQRGVMISLQDVLFDVGSATLKPGAQRTIDRLAEVLKQHPERRVLVEGFTDNVGDEDKNQELSQRRAEAFERALVDRGVEAERIETQGYGEAFPVASNRSPAGRLQNRRVDVVFSDSQGRLTPR